MLLEITQKKTNTVQYHFYMEYKKVELPKKEQNGGCERLGVGEMGRLSIYSQQISKFQRPNAKHTDYSQQYCIINFRVAKRLDLNCSHYKREVVIM